MKGSGKFEIVFTPEDGSGKTTVNVFDFKGLFKILYFWRKKYNLYSNLATITVSIVVFIILKTQLSETQITNFSIGFVILWKHKIIWSFLKISFGKEIKMQLQNCRPWLITCSKIYIINGNKKNLYSI